MPLATVDAISAELDGTIQLQRPSPEVQASSYWDYHLGSLCTCFSQLDVIWQVDNNKPNARLSMEVGEKVRKKEVKNASCLYDLAYFLFISCVEIFYPIPSIFLQNA